MNKVKTAKTISTLTNPPIICIPLFIIICASLSFTPNGFDFGKFIVLEAISLVFASILPMAIILFWVKRLNTDRDISNRSDRYMPLIVGIISYFIGFLICYFFKLDNFLTCLLLCYSINTGVVLLFTTKWKISVHTTALSGPVAALILLLGPFGAIFGLVYPVLIWSRVLLKKHTMAQAISGGVQGFFLTPVLLGFLSYIKTGHPQKIFIIGEIILLVLFFFMTPSGTFIIFALTTLASVLISLYAGDDFIWNKVISGQSFNTL